MELDPDLDELKRVCDGLMQCLIEDEGEEWVCFVYLVRRNTIRFYEDLDDFDASVAISKHQTD